MLNVGKQWAAAEQRNDEATARHIIDDRLVEKGKASTDTYRYTVTYLYRDRRWIALAEHLVKVPEPR